MTEFPQLAEALDAAARRRYGRRRLPSLVPRLALPALAVAAAALAGVTVLGGGDTLYEDERPVATTPALAEYGRAFTVFRRDLRPSDRLPPAVARMARDLAGAGTLHDTRLARTSGDSRFYLLPVRDARGPQLCVIVAGGSRPRDGSCTTLAAAADPATPLATLGNPQDGRADDAWVLLPDGSRDVRLYTDDAGHYSLSIRGNVATLRGLRKPRKLTWTGPDGRRHRLPRA